MKDMDLIGQLVTANVDAAAHTSHLIESGQRRDIAELCETITLVAKILDEAMVVDRRTEERLRLLFWPKVGSAERLLESTRQMQVRFDGVTPQEGWATS